MENTIKLTEEITEVSDNKGESNPIPLKETEKDTSDVTSIDVKSCEKLVRENAYDEHGLFKAGYEHYSICIKDFNYDKSTKPIMRDVISLISDNITNAIDQECYDDLRTNMKLTDGNRLLLSGLFVFKVDTPEDYKYRINDSDIKIDVLVPVDTVNSQIAKCGSRVSYDVGSFLINYPTINGYILSMDAVKKLLLNKDNIIFKASCADMNAIYDWGNCLYRISNGDLVIIDDYKVYSSNMTIEEFINAK